MAKNEKLTDEQIDNEAKTVGEIVNQEVKQMVRIPFSEMNPNIDCIPVTINGYTWVIKKGVDVEVPKSVRDILIEAKYI